MVWLRFLTSFIVSLILIVVLLDLTDNNFIPAFILSLVIAVLAVKSGEIN